jgi:hypothetical protein
MAKKDDTNQAPELDPVDQAAAAEVAAMQPADAPKGISEEEIREKTLVGLTRDQAIEVITNQRKHDADLAKAEKRKS